jgi:hypothetical protein
MKRIFVSAALLAASFGSTQLALAQSPFYYHFEASVYNGDIYAYDQGLPDNLADKPLPGFGGGTKVEVVTLHNGATLYSSVNWNDPTSVTRPTSLSLLRTTETLYDHIGWIGHGRYADFTVTVPTAGWYVGTVVFRAFGSRTLYVTDYTSGLEDTQNPANQPHFPYFDVPCTDGMTSQYLTVASNGLGVSATDFYIPMAKGENTIKFDNGGGWAPDVYQFVLQGL